MVLALDEVLHRAAGAMPRRPDAGEGEHRGATIQRNHVGVFFGFVCAHSQNEFTGTRQRFVGPSHRRQCEDHVFLTFAIAAPPNCGSPGIPQRIMASSRFPSTAQDACRPSRVTCRPSQACSQTMRPDIRTRGLQPTNREAVVRLNELPSGLVMIQSARDPFVRRRLPDFFGRFEIWSHKAVPAVRAITENLLLWHI
jgi:hypothetical protein